MNATAPLGVPRPDALPRGVVALRGYFASGWAFLFPYLAAYLFFAATEWPTGALVATFRVIHVVHLAALITIVWFRRTALRELRSSTSAWLLLGFVIIVPGVYLEFPSDAWEHMTRINDWRLVDTVLANTGWKKSSYFLPYSVVGGWGPEAQVVGLRLYTAGLSGLFCWQAYRLAKSIGIGDGIAFVFALLQLFLYGNTAFTFLQYYSVGSTLPAHIAAFAFIRLAVEFASESPPPPLRRTMASGGGLIVLMAFNHPQALLVAGLGAAAVIGWQWRERRPRAFWATALVALGLGAWFHLSPHPEMADYYARTRWLNPWLGFNLLDWNSPAAQRALAILGAIGIVNVGVACVLFVRNRLTSWLTLVPLLALLYPPTATTFAVALSRTSTDYIVIASRVLLGIPAGLALLDGAREWARFRLGSRTLAYPGLLVGVALLVLTGLPSGTPWFNRFWHALARPPADLAMVAPMAMLSPDVKNLRRPDETHFVSAPSLGFVASASGIPWVEFNDRLMGYPRRLTPASILDRTRERLVIRQNTRARLFILDPLSFYTPSSQAALLAGHWNDREVVMGAAGAPEVIALAVALGGRPVRVSFGWRFDFPPHPVP